MDEKNKTTTGGKEDKKSAEKKKEEPKFEDIDPPKTHRILFPGITKGHKTYNGAVDRIDLNCETK